jgi:hypothetical protein
MMIAIPAPHWALFRDLPDQAFASMLRELASSVDLAKYQKQNGNHISTAKLLAQR